MSGVGFDRDLARRLGDRHLRGEVGPKLAHSNCWNRVAVVASLEVAVTEGGQHLLWMVTNLLARQFSIIHELVVSVPTVPIHPGCFPFGGGKNLQLALLNVAKMVAGSAMVVTMSPCLPQDARLSVTVGRAPELRMEIPTVAALGDGSGAFCGLPHHLPADVPVDRCPLGPYFAACLAAGEVFKHLTGLHPGAGRHPDALFYSVWEHRAYDGWENIPDHVLPQFIPLPDVYLVGLGAVGQALLAALVAWPGLQGYLTLIDKDTIDGTNLNRYILAVRESVGASKVDLAKTYLEAAGFMAYAYPGTWQEYTQDYSRPPQRPDLAEKERAFRYELVLSCVDKNSARHAIQNFWPRIVIGGSTSDLRAMVSLYNINSGGECLKCFNPVETASTIEQFAEKIRTIPAYERRKLCEQTGVDAALVETYLKDPRCGTLEETALRRFREQTQEHDWSVGFVSVAAGLLLASRLVRVAIHGIQDAFPLQEGNSAFFNFFNPGPRWSKMNARIDCECQTHGFEEYRRLWVP